MAGNGSSGMVDGPQAQHSDRNRSRSTCAARKSRDRGHPRWPAEKKVRFTSKHPAEMGPPSGRKASICPAAGALSARDLHRRFPGSAVSVARA